MRDLFMLKTKNEKSTKEISAKKSVDEVCKEWLNKAKIRLKYSSFCVYYSIFHNHIAPYFKNYDMATITREDVENFIDYKLQVLESKTVRDIVSVLLQIIKFAERKGFISNFDYDVELPKLQIKELKIMSLTDEKKLNEYLENNLTFENFGVLLAKTTGIRIGELCALQWSDFDLDKGTVNINKTIQRVKNIDVNATSKTKIIITTPKSQKSIREIPLPDIFMATVKKLYNRENADTYVLTGTTKYVEPRIVQRKFKKLLKSLGIMNITFHGLRHLFATRAVERGFDTKSLSEILGHSNVNITLSRYVHSSFDFKRENMNKMTGYLTECKRGDKKDENHEKADEIKVLVIYVAKYETLRREYSSNPIAWVFFIIAGFNE